MSLTKGYALRERIGAGGFGVEAEIVASLEHPHIIPLFDYWRDPNGAYLVMCFMRGGTLRQALASGQWDVARTGLGTVLGGDERVLRQLGDGEMPATGGQSQDWLSVREER
jgi:hypothetical protein